MRSKRLALAVTAILVTLQIVACSQPRIEEPSLAPVRISLPVYLSNGAIFLAESRGYFRDHGVRLERSDVERSNQSLPLLVAGEIDILPAQISTAMLNAVARGSEIRIVAGKAYLDPGGCDHIALVGRPGRSRPASDVEMARFLAGAKVSAQGAAISEFFVDFVERAASVPPGTTERLRVSPSVQIAALEEGQLDLAVLGEPWLTRAGRRGCEVWASAAKLAPDLDTAFVLFGPRLLGPDRDLGVRFLAAYLEGVRDYRAGATAANLAQLSEMLGFDRELLRASCWPQIRSDASVLPTSIETFSIWAVARGWLDRRVDPLEIIDLSLLEQARGRMREGAN